MKRHIKFLDLLALYIDNSGLDYEGEGEEL
jgi:hypothetical protein